MNADEPRLAQMRPIQTGIPSEILELDEAAPEGPMLVGLLEDEPAGVVCTRNPGVAEFEATLEWPSEWETRSPVIPLLPSTQDLGVRSSLRESSGRRLTTVSGSFSGFDEGALSAAMERILRNLLSASGVREATLQTRVLRTYRVHHPDPEAVQRLARLIWEGGFRVRFGRSWSPAPAGAHVVLGCRGLRDELVRILGVECSGGSG